jgi:dTMP kinase
MVTDPEFSRHFEASRQRDTAARQPAGRRRLRTVALVGVDGSGKTTQAHRLATELAALGLPATYRRNAGGRRWFGRLATALGRRDAEHLLGRRGFLLVESVLRWLAIARTLLRRAVTGEIAVMDRYAACQYASLRAHAATPRPERRSRGEWFARLAYRVFPAPDVTFVLVVAPAVAYDRIEARGYDHETMDFLDAATAAYRALPEYGSFVAVDADGDPDEVSAAILAHLAAWLPANAEPPVPAERPVPAEPSVLADHRALIERLVPAERVSRPTVARRLFRTSREAPGQCAATDTPAAALPPQLPEVPPQPAPPAENAKTILLAAAPLAAGASTVGYRVSEAVQSLV